ncbi:hypothetical protein UFOVP1320_55 [uncultured Caudovirales phage]|uniref:Uncharacterized protein n=3 Tax=uncultured Caudovirales phage TaxID=2100421 RepID=A0A6J5PEL3_9CAUD|nr:hypothetical protein UFOVP548_13 [uncultured Caudovirales phage]CAB4169873.1 hypothetical protein UFOVP904_13 [uncultured Caudovirales phage]CAB4183024.1 hypothetical protein UFOVP1079_51 [uncultured Caudovirales phage]CAB4198171.1 hypothetical protein UFOVP1320_55 [uncultured Caudovirales phage]CAB4211872.1 hypothetical protein UFOVP1431_57 [uncultured Caudovirales phage]
MSELYGAPSGIIASDQNIRQNIQAGLQAQKTLGEIEQLPADLALKQSHARLYGAEAIAKEEATAAMREARTWESRMTADMAAESQARLGLIGQIPATQGRNATVADLPPSGRASKASPVDQLQAQADWLTKNNAPRSMLNPLLEKISLVSQHMAAAEHNSAQAENQRALQAKTTLDTIGGIAGTAARSPIDYLSITSNPAYRQYLPPGLTGNYWTDKPALQAIADASVEQKDKIRLAQEKLNTDSQIKLRDAETKTAVARERVLSLRADDLKTVADNGGKTNGPNSVSTREKNNQAIRASEERVFAAQLKFAPMIPLDPDVLKQNIGRMYTMADRRIVRVMGIDANKEPILHLVEAPERKRLLRDKILAQPDVDSSRGEIQ